MSSFCCGGSSHNAIVPTSSLAIPKPTRMESDSSDTTISELMAKNSKHSQKICAQTQQVHHLSLAFVVPSKIPQFCHLVESFNKPIFQEEGTLALVVDHSLIVQLVTNRALQILRKSAEELIGHHLSLLVKKINKTNYNSEQVIHESLFTRFSSISFQAILDIGDQQQNYKMHLIKSMERDSNYFFAIFRTQDQTTPRRESIISDQEKTIHNFQEATLAKVNKKDLVGDSEKNSVIYFKPEMDIPGKKEHFLKGLKSLPPTKKTDRSSFYLLCDRSLTVLAATCNTFSITNFSQSEIVGQNISIITPAVTVGKLVTLPQNDLDSISPLPAFNLPCCFNKKGYDANGIQLSDACRIVVELSESPYYFVVTVRVETKVLAFGPLNLHNSSSTTNNNDSNRSSLPTLSSPLTSSPTMSTIRTDEQLTPPNAAKEKKDKFKTNENEEKKSPPPSKHNE